MLHRASPGKGEGDNDKALTEARLCGRICPGVANWRRMVRLLARKEER